MGAFAVLASAATAVLHALRSYYDSY